MVILEFREEIVACAAMAIEDIAKPSAERGKHKAVIDKTWVYMVMGRLNPLLSRKALKMHEAAQHLFFSFQRLPRLGTFYLIAAWCQGIITNKL